MTAQACADLVRRGDPDRWRTAMTAPPERRAGLMALYAFNLEIARAPWLASEPMLAEIRLQWWQDAVAEIYAGTRPRRHEVVEPLAGAIRAGDLPRGLFEETIAARLFDAGSAPHADRPALLRQIDRTAGHVMVLAALHLGAPEAALDVVRRFALGTGIAALLRALPELRARGHATLPATVPIEALAAEGLQALAEARAARHLVPRAVLPALLPGWLAGLRLGRAAADPEAVWRGELEVAPIRARAALLRAAATGRW
ncbi:squalene/phytoene synthase family protein [Amaricoccus sp.]|uniref:phytoene/squalene synthase family protein n=1 Tax=Amaricoccus sp. TaxID=1872485 RepID=UPI002BEFABE7|nr:squalene/phytoene synthase family protein [Amaricoccus sp.]HRW15779.1 squalene/phytoene synthase family protein [Amaricoccus sp.]